MLARSHIATAILAGLLFRPLGLPPADVFLFFLIILISALFTDLDHPDSTIGHAFPILAWLTNKMLGHRGFLHSLLVPAVLWFGARSIGHPLIGLSILVGMISHLFCDGLTKNGVNLLHPFAECRIRGFITTGGWIEAMYFWAVLVLIVFFMAQEFLPAPLWP